MDHLNIQRRLALPASHLLIARIERYGSKWGHHPQFHVRQSILLIEHREVLLERWAPIGVNDDDSLPLPTIALVIEGGYAIGVPELLWGVRDAESHIRRCLRSLRVGRACNRCWRAPSRERA